MVNTCGSGIAGVSFFVAAGGNTGCAVLLLRKCKSVDIVLKYNWVGVLMRKPKRWGMIAGGFYLSEAGEAAASYVVSLVRQ